MILNTHTSYLKYKTHVVVLKPIYYVLQKVDIARTIVK